MSGSPLLSRTVRHVSDTSPDGEDSICVFRRSSLRSGAGQEDWPALFLALDPVCGAPIMRRGQGSGGARPRSGRRALTPSPFGARCSGVDGSKSGSLGGWVGGRGSHQGPVRAGLEQAGWLLGHRFAALVPGSLSVWGRHDGVRRVRSVGVNQNARPRRRPGRLRGS